MKKYLMSREKTRKETPATSSAHSGIISVNLQHSIQLNSQNNGTDFPQLTLPTTQPSSASQQQTEHAAPQQQPGQSFLLGNFSKGKLDSAEDDHLPAVSGNDPKNPEDSGPNTLKLLLPADTDCNHQMHQLLSSEKNSEKNVHVEKTQEQTGEEFKHPKTHHCSTCNKWFATKSDLKRHHDSKLLRKRSIHVNGEGLDQKTPSASAPIIRGHKRSQPLSSDSSNSSNSSLPTSPQRLKLEDVKSKLEDKLLDDKSGKNDDSSGVSSMHESGPKPSSLSVRPSMRFKELTAHLERPKKCALCQRISYDRTALCVPCLWKGLHAFISHLR